MPKVEQKVKETNNLLKDSAASGMVKTAVPRLRNPAFWGLSDKICLLRRLDNSYSSRLIFSNPLK